MNTRVDKLGVILVHHFLLNYRIVSALLGKSRNKEKELDGENSLDKKRIEDRHTRTGVERCKWKEEDVNKNMPRAEEAKEADRDRKGVPNRQFPYVLCLVWMRSGFG
jgi:hypothetical protein